MTLLQMFYADYFDGYLNQMIIGNEEKSVVTLFKGMDFFIQLTKELNVKFAYKTIEDYIISEYENGEEIYKKLENQYNLELKDYNDKEKKFEDIFGCEITDF